MATKKKPVKRPNPAIPQNAIHHVVHLVIHRNGEGGVDDPSIDVGGGGKKMAKK